MQTLINIKACSFFIKGRIRRIFIFIFLTGWISELRAQTCISRLESAHAWADSLKNHAAKVHLGLRGGGISYDGLMRPGALYNGKCLVFTDGLWLGAYDDAGNPFVAAQNYNQKGFDFAVGPLRTDGTAQTDNEFCENFDRVFRVTREEVEAFKADFDAGNPVSAEIHPAVFAWPGSIHADGFETGLAPFHDLNSDGVYNPAEGDHPFVFGDETAFWVINDLTAHSETDSSPPLGVEIRYLAFTFNNPADADRYHSTFYRVKIINRSARNYPVFTLGLWADFDLGFEFDDYFGCDTLRHLGYVYNGDDFDETMKGFGNDWPSAGYTLFRGMPGADDDGADNNRNGATDEPGEDFGLSGFMCYYNYFDKTGNPQSSDDFLRYLSGKWIDDSLWVDDREHNGNAYPDSGESAPPTRYFYPDPPPSASPCTNVPANGWSMEIGEEKPIFDRRAMMLSGPGRLPAGGEITVDYAVVIAAPTQQPNDSPCELFGRVDRLRNGYPQHYMDNWVSSRANVPPIRFKTKNLGDGRYEFEGLSPNASLTFYDLAGRRLALQSPDLRDFPAGLYVCRVRDGDRSVAVRLIRP